VSPLPSAGRPALPLLPEGSRRSCRSERAFLQSVGAFLRARLVEGNPGDLPEVAAALWDLQPIGGLGLLILSL